MALKNDRIQIQLSGVSDFAPLDGVAEAAVVLAELGDAFTVEDADTDVVEEVTGVGAAVEEDALELEDNGDMTRSMTCISPLFVSTLGFVRSASLK